VNTAALRRFNVLFEIVPFGFFALAAVVTPRLTYAFQSWVLSHAFRVHAGPLLEDIDLRLCAVVLCLTPLVIFDCWRASRLLAATRADAQFATHPALLFAFAAAFFTPAWVPPLVEVFGHGAVVAGSVGRLASFLSYLAFVVAAAQIEAERIGVKPGTLALSTLYHLGGSPGVALARRLYPASEACAEVAKEPPAAALFLAAVVILAALQGLL
jgi:hypothetical protein